MAVKGKCVYISVSTSSLKGFLCIIPTTYTVHIPLCTMCIWGCCEGWVWCLWVGGKKGRHEAQAPSNQVKNYKQTWLWEPSETGSRAVWSISSVIWPAPLFGHTPDWSCASLFKVSMLLSIVHDREDSGWGVVEGGKGVVGGKGGGMRRKRHQTRSKIICRLAP